MPSSFVDQITDIVNLIIYTEPKSMLDVGIGFGKYGFLAREYLEIMTQSQDYHQRQVRIDGVEAFAEYVTPIHRAIYDEIHIGDARDILPKLTLRYDLLIMIDVIEHFTFDDGMRMLTECGKRSRNVLISTPKWMAEQDALYGNEFERHKFQWAWRHLKSLPGAFRAPNSDSLICYYGEDAANVRKKLHRHRLASRVKRTFPAAIPLLKRITGLGVPER